MSLSIRLYGVLLALSFILIAYVTVTAAQAADTPQAFFDGMDTGSSMKMRPTKS